MPQKKVASKKKAATHTETKFDPKKVAPAHVKGAHIRSLDDYKKLYNQSVKNPTAFTTLRR